MANIQLTELDFDNIKNNLKTFLKNQNVLQDANYEGSVLSIVLDLLAYNTHYNAFYLNMLANELFLDTATKRNSVVSLAKLLGYVPSSRHSCEALVDITFNGVSVSSVTIPKYTKFICESIDDKFYTFVTTQDYYKQASNNQVTFSSVQLLEGQPTSLRKIYYKRTNPRSTFLLPDINVDLNTIEVKVQKSTIDATSQTYNKKEIYSTLDSTTPVYFVEENSDGFYEVYFGDGILGKALVDGNVVLISYVISSGINSVDASDFKIVDPLKFSTTGTTITTVLPAYGGKEKEGIDSIKFSAPKYFSAQNRAVTYEDYIAALTNNVYNYSFDSVNVWGGENNDPPVYGKIFMALKPTGAYTLTNIQKETIKSKILKPISVLTVEPEIVDPDYVFIKLDIKVVYDNKKTTLTASQVGSKVRSAVFSFANETLNNFNSTFSFPDLIYAIQNADSSIITNECNISLIKKFFPDLEVPTTYKLDFGCELNRGILYKGISSSPSLSFYDKTSTVVKVNNVFIEEVPLTGGTIDSISVTNKGYGYTSVPTVTIDGDGTGASARAVIVNGSIKQIVIDNPGYDYNSAKITISGGGGKLGAGFAVISGSTGTLKTVYKNSSNKTITLNENIGQVNYLTGVIELNDFNPLNVNNPLAQLSIIAKPKSNIISSGKNRILTIDPFDSTSVVINVVGKE